MRKTAVVAIQFLTGVSDQEQLLDMVRDMGLLSELYNSKEDEVKFDK